ncbi:iron-containing alcohol dehydrogenase family protein [Flavobacteriaceae bacterium M23B6Z8]
MKFKNFPMVPRVMFGRGSFDQLHEILLPRRKNSDSAFIFLVDDVFEKNDAFLSRLPLLFNDQIIFISADEEPKTDQVDALVGHIKNTISVAPDGIIGIGGGTVMDLAKAVSLLFTNPGSASDYQGWDLIKKKGLYHIGIPTISGTGAEVSRTTVLSGPDKKLGINSDYTPFDQVILDPELTIGVNREQWFFTGMDCYIHCIESLKGSFLNAFSQSYGEKAYDLCLDVFAKNGISEEENRSKLMMASWHGGMSIAYSQVGIAHAMSYGLSYVLGIRHGEGNCLVFDHLEDYYPEGVRVFKEMKERNEIELRKEVCKHLSQEDYDKMTTIALSLEPLWENALGKDWRSIITPEKLQAIYKKI